MSKSRWQPYSRYKDSGVEWLGEIPAHWRVKRLKYAAMVNPEVLSEDTDLDFVMQYVDISNVDSAGTILGTQEMRFQNAPSRARRRVRNNDVIISTVRTYLRAIAFVGNPPDNLIVSTGFAVLRPTSESELEPRYAWRLVQSSGFVDTVVAHSEGIGYPAIAPTRLADLPVWLPPLDEQRAIATFLDREAARIDALVAKQGRLIALLQEKCAALISHTVTKGLDPRAPMRDSNIPWVGEIPAHWAIAPVYARYQVQLGKMLDQKQITGEHLWPYLRNIDVQWDQINTADLPEMDFPPSSRARFALQSGDLLVCEGGEVGRAAIWRGELEECYYQKALHRLRPYRHSDVPRFLYYVLYNAAKQGIFVASGNPNTIDHLTAEKLSKHRFAFPPAQEQRTIATYLDRETAKLDALIAKAREMIERLQEYRTALISAAVTGKIDVR